MLLGRFLPIVFVLRWPARWPGSSHVPGHRGHAAHPPAAVRRPAASASSSSSSALTYFPALALGPLAEGLHEAHDRHDIDPRRRRVPPHRVRRLLDPRQLLTSLPDACASSTRARSCRNPVMFVVEVGVGAHHRARRSRDPSVFAWVDRRLAVADGGLRQPRRGGRRGPRQGAGRRRLRRTRTETVARRLAGWTPGTADADRGARCRRPSCTLGDHRGGRGGEVIPGDGDVVEGIASVDESAITGESAPVIRESGGDRSARSPAAPRCCRTGSSCGSPPKPGETFLDRMIALVEGARGRRRPTRSR